MELFKIPFDNFFKKGKGFKNPIQININHGKRAKLFSYIKEICLIL